MVFLICHESVVLLPLEKEGKSKNTTQKQTVFHIILMTPNIKNTNKQEHVLFYCRNVSLLIRDIALILSKSPPRRGNEDVSSLHFLTVTVFQFAINRGACSSSFKRSTSVTSSEHFGSVVLKGMSQSGARQSTSSSYYGSQPT